MKRDAEISLELADALQRLPIGKKLTMNFKGEPTPVEVKYTFSGGWVITQLLHPGVPLEIVKGEGGTLQKIDITLLPYDGLAATN
ncbi:hypothetical protein PS631_00258 [Pseudomonas fluorescens]|uniref:Uncharacterized protein n=1 Tax=Pseudomonas fluorescens TaxID=294 RepID=A0A5E6PBC2_PSEFL|nr:hypothetical protein [Pseudomonas fluorescens]VVM40543.1 hypothetical protein PS631_00258 [Pseudomonas fluorescens]